MKTLAKTLILSAVVISTSAYVYAAGCSSCGSCSSEKAADVKVEKAEVKACCSGKDAEKVKSCCEGKLTAVKKAGAGHACCEGKDADKVKKCCDGKLVAAPKAAFEKGSEWLEDFEVAKKLSAKTGKKLFTLFTGSDWCPYCVKLEEGILAKKDFLKYASDSLILVKIDFPRGKKQSEELKAANQKLASEYGIRGFPTVLLQDEKGKILGRTGYRDVSASDYVKHLKDFLK